MKATDLFKKTIKSYLDQRAEKDTLFATSYSKPGKNLDDCITYILNAVQKSGCNGFEDDEIYSMAVHYYDEDNIEIGQPVNCSVAVNHVVELTEEEKKQAHDAAFEKLMEEQCKSLKKRAMAKKKEKKETLQMNLFG